MRSHLGAESAGSGPDALSQVARQTLGPAPAAGPAEPRLARRISLRGWSAFDRRFFRLAAIPAFLAVFLVTVIPFVAGFGLSFSSMNSTSNRILPPTLANYRNLFQDPVTVTALLNTVMYVALAVVLESAFGLLLGVLLARKSRAIRVGSSRVDLQACKLEYSIVSPK